MKKTPFDPELRVAARFKLAAFEAGLICYPTAGTRDGRNGDHVLLAQPFVIGDEHISQMIHKLSLALIKVTSEID